MRPEDGVKDCNHAPDDVDARTRLMEVLREFLVDLKRHGYARGNFLGLLNVLIGRRVDGKNGRVVSAGMTWRAAAEYLQKVRWEKEAVRELGIDPGLLPPKDRQRYWYQAIGLAGIDSPKALAAGDRLAATLRSAGYRISP